MRDLEKYFKNDTEYAISIERFSNDANGFFVPSVSINALYLPYHIAEHFFHGEVSLRQLCDLVLFVKKHHNHISCHNAKEWAKKSGFFKFYCYLNGILQDYWGLEATYFPNWSRDKKLEERVMNNILTKREALQLSLFTKVIRYFDQVGDSN